MTCRVAALDDIDDVLKLLNGFWYKLYFKKITSIPNSANFNK